MKFCGPPDQCPYGPILGFSGKNYIYDLQDHTAAPSIIDHVSDVWPHAA